MYLVHDIRGPQPVPQVLQLRGTQVHHKTICVLCHRIQGSIGDLEPCLDLILVFKVKVQPGDTGGGVTK